MISFQSTTQTPLILNENAKVSQSATTNCDSVANHSSLVPSVADFIANADNAIEDSANIVSKPTRHRMHEQTPADVEDLSSSDSAVTVVPIDTNSSVGLATDSSYSVSEMLDSVPNDFPNPTQILRTIKVVDGIQANRRISEPQVLLTTENDSNDESFDEMFAYSPQRKPYGRSQSDVSTDKLLEAVVVS